MGGIFFYRLPYECALRSITQVLPGSVLPGSICSRYVVFNPSTGEITGTLGFDAANTYSVTVTATDSDTDEGSVTFTLVVNDVNQPPVLDSLPSIPSYNSGETITPIVISATDPDLDTLTYSAANLPTGISMDASTGTLSGTIIDDAGTFQVVIVVTDDGTPKMSDTTSFTWTIGETPNLPPTANAGADQTVVDTDNSGDEQVTLDGTGSSDSDGTIASYSWTENSVEIGTGATPSVNLSVGTHNITLIVTDDDGATAFDTVVITVEAGSTGVNRVTNSLLALYEFNETGGNTVADTSGAGSPMNLTISNTGNVSQGGGALTVNSSTVIQSSGAATKLIDGIKSTNEVTLEAWIQSNNLTQSGPARVAGISGNPSNRNITLGQGLWGSQPMDVYDMRLRTRSTNPNGTPSLSTPAGTATTNLMHVVLTHEANGTSRIYVNGVAVATHNQGSDMGNWDTSFPFVLANEPTGDRPWLGTFYLVAVYNRALSSSEVQQNYNAGANGT